MKLIFGFVEICLVRRGFLKLILSILFFTLSHSSQSQSTADSLRLNAILTKAVEIRLNKPDSSIYYAKQVIEQLPPTSFYLHGFANYIISYSNWVKANYKLSAEYGFRSLKYIEMVEGFQYDKSLVLLDLGRTFLDLEYPKEGKKYLDRVLTIAVTNREDIRILANYYRELSLYYAKQNLLDSSLYAANKGIELYSLRKDTLNTSVLYGRKARVFLVQKKYTEALELSSQAMLLDSLVGNRRGFGISNLQIATAWLGLSQADSALYYLSKSIRANHEISNWQALYQGYKTKSEAHLLKNQPLLAVDNLKLAEIYKDSLFNVRSSGQIEEMKIIYETEKKDNTIQLLEKDNALRQQQSRNQRITVIALGLLILLLWAILFILMRAQRQKQKANEQLTERNKSIEQQKEEMQLQAEKLQDLNHLKSKLFSVISHDLRGPINNLQSLLDLFSKNLLSQEEFLKHSDKLRANVNVTQRTLENLLNWSLSQMEGIRTRPTILDIKTSVEEAGRLLQDLATRKNIHIINEITSSLLVYADPDQVQVILRNLIHNGIKFSKTNCDVTISASILAEEKMCCIVVKDSGIGMTSEEMSRLEIVKEHFTKIGTFQEKGTGLGILLCREFVHRNDGKLTVKSDPGIGTEVCFTLPLA